MRTVLDASAAVNLVMRTAAAPRFVEVLEQSDIVLAPSLFSSEVANTIWKYAQAGVIDRHAAVARLDEARALVDVIEPVESLCTEALSLAMLHDHPVYDLLYVVTALRFGATLLTADKRLKRLASMVNPSLV